MTTARRATGSSPDGGSITAFSVVLLLALFVVIGSVVDGGAALSAHQGAVDVAEQAARAGAGALSVGALRSGSLQLDDQQAIAAAQAFAATSGHAARVWIAGQTVFVHIDYRIPTSILGIVGVTSLPVSASASAVDVAGVTQGP